MDIVNKKISQSDWQCTGEDHRENSNNCSDLISHSWSGPLHSNSSVSTLNYVSIKAVNNKATRIRLNWMKATVK